MLNAVDERTSFVRARAHGDDATGHRPAVARVQLRFSREMMRAFNCGAGLIDDDPLLDVLLDRIAHTPNRRVTHQRWRHSTGTFYTSLRARLTLCCHPLVVDYELLWQSMGGSASAVSREPLAFQPGGSRGRSAEERMKGEGGWASLWCSSSDCNNRWPIDRSFASRIVSDSSAE